MTQYKNTKQDPDERIRIRGVIASITMSGRGYVELRALSEERETISEYVDDEAKSAISALPYEVQFKPWQEEMAKLRASVIERARREWAPGPRNKPPRRGHR